MSTAITNFESAKLPSFLRAPEGSVTNALAALASGNYPFLSIKGKRFAVVRNKEETILMRPDDDETPANAIEVVIVNAATQYSKVYYVKGYTDGSKDKPTCYSNDGQAPAADAADKQSKKCSVCPHNEWNTGPNGKGKACSDSLRLAVSAATDLNDPMLLRVPPASLKAITEYASMLARKGAPMEGVITKIKFDPAEATPKLQFSVVNFQSEAAYNETIEIARSQLVQQIIGAVAAPAKPIGPMLDEDDAQAAEQTRKELAAEKAAEAKKEEKVEKPKKEKSAPTPTATKATDLAAKMRASLDDDDDDA